MTKEDKQKLFKTSKLKEVVNFIIFIIPVMVILIYSRFKYGN